MGTCKSKSNPNPGKNGRRTGANERGVLLGTSPESMGYVKSDTSIVTMRSVKSGGFRRSDLILEKTDNVHELYDFDAVAVGVGTFGSVTKARKRATGSVRAIKTVCKNATLEVNRLKREIYVMKRLDHPNIVNLYETFEDDRNHYFAMEYCGGGELFDHLIANGTYGEPDAAIIMKQLLSAVCYMHEQKICHRDLKPENMLFAAKGPIKDAVLKVIDFGSACCCLENQILSARMGTLTYMAPEVFTRCYCLPCDLWSCGVIMYILLSGREPFPGRTECDMRRRLQYDPLIFPQRSWEHVSDAAKELAASLLRKPTKKRLTAQQAWQHSWFSAADDSSLPAVTLEPGMVESLRKFNRRHKLWKAAMHIIAGQSCGTCSCGDGSVRLLRDTFAALDLNSDGLISTQELKTGLAQASVDLAPADLDDMMESIDVDGSGEIDYSEFLAAASEYAQLRIREEVYMDAFSVFDVNGDGQISVDELMQVLPSDAASSEELEVIMGEVDANGDGIIDFLEFKKMLDSSTPCMSLSRETP